jgi:hypothetical protein
MQVRKTLKITLYAESIYTIATPRCNKLMEQKPKLLEQVRAVARARHLSHKAEDTYHNFIKSA